MILKFIKRFFDNEEAFAEGQKEFLQVGSLTFIAVLAIVIVLTALTPISALWFLLKGIPIVLSVTAAVAATCFAFAYSEYERQN